jgi:hypothetical protein
MRDILLITQYYNESDAMRQAEMELCLKKNLENEQIHSVHLMVNDYVKGYFGGAKINPHYILPNRAKFKHAFDLAKSIGRNDCIYVIANSDIYFDESIVNLRDGVEPRSVAVVTRRDLERDWTLSNAKSYKIGEKTVKQDPKFSYDAWAFDSSIFESNFENDFYMGVFNAECRLSEEILKANINMYNLDKRVNAIHVHWSEKRKTRIGDFEGLNGYDGGYFDMPSR